MMSLFNRNSLDKIAYFSIFFRHLLLFDHRTGVRHVLMSDDTFCSYTVMDVSVTNSTIAIANIRGVLRLIKVPGKF